MNMKQFPVIDPIATGKNIIRLRVERGMSVRDLQSYFGFEEPQAIYKWQQGKSLPSVDNLYALGALFEVPMEDILVSRTSKLNLVICEQQAGACCSPLFIMRGVIPLLRHGDISQTLFPVKRLSLVALDIVEQYNCFMEYKRNHNMVYSCRRMCEV